VTESLPDEGSALTPAVASAHPFDVDPHDHAETPFVAYKHIAPLLNAAARAQGTLAADLRLYDPYYCEGTVVAHLGLLGFPRVYNANEDFYSTAAAGAAPPHDVLVTNPPFSGDHMERFCSFLRERRKPWFALMPAYVARKRYFWELKAHLHAAGLPAPFYLGPTEAPYSFTAPSLEAGGSSALVDAASRAVDAAGAFQHVRAGKFQCIWFVWLGPNQSAVLEEFRRDASGIETQAAAGSGTADSAAACSSVGSSKPAAGIRARATSCGTPVSIASCEAGAAYASCVASLADAPAHAGFAIEMEDERRLPQLQIAKKLAPAERRWRKKQRGLAHTATRGSALRDTGSEQGRQ